MSTRYEQVAEIADRLNSQGIKPAVRNIRELLGSGSFSTVIKHLHQWQTSQVRMTQTINDTFDPAISSAISEQIANRVKESNAASTARIAELQDEIETLISENEHQGQVIEEQASDLTAIQEKHAALLGRVQQLNIEIERLSADLVDERHASETARVSLAKSELRLEAVPHIENEIEKIRTELSEARALASELHEAAAVADARHDAEAALRNKVEAQLAETILQRDKAAKRSIALAVMLGNERKAARTVQDRLEASQLREQMKSAKQSPICAKAINRPADANKSRTSKKQSRNTKG